MSKDFRSRCKGKAPTISLFKIKNGDCIGGYTSVEWTYVGIDGYADDNGAMLFNLPR